MPTQNFNRNNLCKAKKVKKVKPHNNKTAPEQGTQRKQRTKTEEPKQTRTTTRNTKEM